MRRLRRRDRRRWRLAALAVLVIAGGAAAWVVADRLRPDRPRVPEGAVLTEPETVEIAAGDYYVSFAGTSPDHRWMAYAREQDDSWEVVVADAVSARPLSMHVSEAPRVAFGWRGSVFELAEQADACRRASVARPPRWRFEAVPCSPDHGEGRRREELPPAPIDLRPATQCDPNPSVKAPRRRLWAVEVCTDQGLRDPVFAHDIRLVDGDGDFVAQLADLFQPAWAADGSLLAVAADGQRLVRVPAAEIP